MSYPGWNYGIDSIQVNAKHTFDAGDIVKFMCKAGTFTHDVTALDMSEPAWKMTIDTSPMDCTKVITGPGGLVGLIVAIVQGLVLIILGPTIMLYGPTVPRFTSLIKAVVVSSYLLLINSIVSVNAFTAFTVFERAVTFFISTLTVTYTSLNNPGAKAKAAGFALGTLIAVPLVAFIGELLITLPSINCKGKGTKREWFPNGEPTGCDLNSVEFQAVYQCMQLLKWIIITVSAIYGKKTMNFSTATVGASMLVKGVVDLTKAVGFQVLSPADAGVILLVITPARAWVTYGVAIGGFFLQRKLITMVSTPAPEGGDKPPKITYEKKDPSPECCNIACGGLLKVCNAVDGFLERNLETLKDGGKGALMRQMTRSVNRNSNKTDTILEMPSSTTKDVTVTVKDDDTKEKDTGADLKA